VPAIAATRNHALFFDDEGDEARACSDHNVRASQIHQCWTRGELRASTSMVERAQAAAPL